MASGAMRLDLATFLRGIGGVAGPAVLPRRRAALWYFGEPIRRFLEARLGPLAVLFAVLLLGGFVVLRFAV